LHKTLGPSISYVKSVTDEFSEKQLGLLRIGGNARLAAYFGGYGVPLNSPPNYKYLMIAAEWYRRALLAEFEGRPPENEPPAQEIAIVLIEP
jgi:hypothetical protein